MREFYSAEAQGFPSLAAATNVSIFGVGFAVQSAVVLLVTGCRGRRTATVSQRRAPAAACRRPPRGPTVARLLGIPVERMILYTFLINAQLCRSLPCW